MGSAHRGCRNKGEMPYMAPTFCTTAQVFKIFHVIVVIYHLEQKLELFLKDVEPSLVWYIATFTSDCICMFACTLGA